MPTVAPTAAPADTIGSDIEARTADPGLDLTSVDFLTPRLVAPEITLQTDDPKAFIEDPPPLSAVVGDSVDTMKVFYRGA